MKGWFDVGGHGTGGQRGRQEHQQHQHHQQHQRQQAHERSWAQAATATDPGNSQK